MCACAECRQSRLAAPQLAACTAGWLSFVATTTTSRSVTVYKRMSNENPHPKRRPCYCVQWKSLKSTSQNPPTPDRRRPGKSTNQIPGRSTAAGRENQQSKEPRSASAGAVFVQFSPKVFDLYCTALHCTALHCKEILLKKCGVKGNPIEKCAPQLTSY